MTVEDLIKESQRLSKDAQVFRTALPGTFIPISGAYWTIAVPSDCDRKGIMRVQDGGDVEQNTLIVFVE